MSENTQNQNPKQEQYSLNDDRRVKVLSPGALVAKRFFRNRLAVVGLSILVAMFLFSFVGGLVSPYGQDEQFFTYTQMSKELSLIHISPTNQCCAPQERNTRKGGTPSPHPVSLYSVHLSILRYLIS